MAERVPARIDRAALERIIQRATELQTGEREIGEGLTPDEVVALGKDVGIPERYLQQALLEERTHSPAAQVSGVIDRIVGPLEVAAQRVVRGEQDAVERELLRWMEENELLAIQRQQQGRVTWEPLRGMQVAFRRSAAVLGNSKRPFMLSKASRVAATITPLEPGYCHVALSAELRAVRGSIVGGGSVFVAMGAAASAALALMSPLWWVVVLPLPFSLGVGYAVARQYRPIAERVQLGLERALDHLERGEVKPSHALPYGRPSIIGLIAEEVRKALRP
jgi:hypothetical protein